mmetsp:Transcript_26341/g.23236  ORF Transcript_26341/g.23236 Transcript_26341/m.23236 type:complete len:412 (+) Transcript_26341:62-1297(+)
MLARPTVAVFNTSDATKVVNKVQLPSVCSTPVRLDIVQFVHDQISKNARQAHGVASNAGMQHAAESWGTGRAVARIPRVTGSGTHRSGQGAFGNMCRKGRMFAPLKTWRRWHRKVNLKQKRHAVASALAASSMTPLVIARGHKISQVPYLPLVVDDQVEGLEKTKDVIAFLKRVGAYEDVERVINNSSTRPGQGKLRYHRIKTRKGPLFVYANENANLIKSVRNIPGVDICNVHRLNLRQLAPGGHVGRFIIYTEAAFKALDQIFGTENAVATEKKGYKIHKTVLTNPDIAQIINSNTVQNAIREKREPTKVHPKKVNPYNNDSAMESLNPHRVNASRMEKTANEANRKKRQEALKAKRGVYAGLTKEQKKTLKDRKKNSDSYMRGIQKHLEDAYPQKVKEEEEEEEETAQ